MDNERQRKKVLRRCDRSSIEIDRKLKSIGKRKQTQHYSVSSFRSSSPPHNCSIYSTLKDNSYLRKDTFDQKLFGRYRVTSTSSFYFRSCERNNRSFYSYGTDSVLNSSVSPVYISEEKLTNATMEAATNDTASPSSSLQDELVCHQVEVVPQSKLRHCLPQQQNVSKVRDTVESSEKTKTLSELFIDYYSKTDANNSVAVNDEANEVRCHESKANVQLTNKALRSPFIADNSLKLYSYDSNSESTQRQDAGYFTFNKNIVRADHNDKRLRWQCLPDSLESSLTSSSEKLQQIKRELYSKKMK